MSALQAQQIIHDHAAEMDDSPQAFAMLKLCVAVTRPDCRAVMIHRKPLDERGQT